MRDLPLADELFLVGHDEYNGKSIVNTDVLGCGLAGAVLGELLLAGRLALVDGRVVVRDPRPYHEPVTDAALAEVRRSTAAHGPRDWIGYLCGNVREVVARRLATAGRVRREQSRGL